ncbi:amidohydrolase [Pedobacter sp. JCM 36344]|uniref:amidohydrolase n=1 Tax=Pedobacter sp. JCM 36344 TaxID=3374280 RepID=UPI0039792D13
MPVASNISYGYIQDSFDIEIILIGMWTKKYKYMKLIFFYLPIVTLLCACSAKKQADLVVYNAKVYTVDGSFSVVEAFAVKDGKILQTGSSTDIQAAYNGKEVLDVGGKAVYPGFIDGHSHFFQYGVTLQQVDLTGTASWQEVLQRLIEFSKTNEGGWLIGRGWDQNDWTEKQFPTNSALDSLFPGRPVFLTRIDGHAAIANTAAIKTADLKAGQQLTGGDIVTFDGKLTGLLVDNAVDLVSEKIPSGTAIQVKAAVLAAQQNCFAVGLTSVTDCGLDHEAVDFIDSLQKQKELKMRMYVMLSDKPVNYDYLFAKGAIKTDRLNVRSFKVYADGALGSRGACLLQPYSDRDNHRGFLLNDKKHFQEVAEKIFNKGFQMCTHAIGDSANREILNIYAKVLRGRNDRRWRIEHAQVISPQDFAQFGKFSIIPSVQSTHATSDMYWAGERLGKERIKGAYANKQLMKQNGWLVLGTDFPVEEIDPVLTFNSAVFRKDKKGYPNNGFQMENALTREEALRGMTIWAARGSFEENEKGSIEKGKFADFVILDEDIMKVSREKVLKVKVIKTYLNGDKVYEKKNY